MVRLVATALIAAAALAAESPGRKPRERPPSSLEPGEVRGKVVLTHDHQRVVSCRGVSKRGRVSCQEEQEASEIGTSLQLRPVDPSGKLSKADRRVTVDVKLADAPNPQEQEVELAAGCWEVQWSHFTERARFVLADGDELSIGLFTVSGACQRVRARCVVAPATVKRRVQIPERHRVP